METDDKNCSLTRNALTAVTDHDTFVNVSINHSSEITQNEKSLFERDIKEQPLEIVLSETQNSSSEHYEDPTEGYLNGPDQVLPADSLVTVLPHGRVKLRLKNEAPESRKPISLPTALERTATKYPSNVALAWKKNASSSWTQLNYREYRAAVRTCAKAFLKLGLKRSHAVCILGFNSPEWFISDLAAIHAGGFATGIYTTNSPEACYFVLASSRANIAVVEDQRQLEKILQVRGRLPELKTIIQYTGIPQEEGVYSWESIMKIGREESDEELEKALKRIAINECCTLVYTSGTVGLPKAVMLSHDNLVWTSQALIDHLGVHEDSNVTIVSYLPLSHIAAQMIDMYITIAVGGSVYFADQDALKGSLAKTLQEVRPTHFFGVPRVWEKIHEKITQIGKQKGFLTQAISSWAKWQGLQHNLDKMNGICSNTVGYKIARSLIFNKVKQALGFDRCAICISGAAPLALDIKKYFMSLDIIILEAYGMSENAGGHAVSNNESFRLDSVANLPGIQTMIYNPDNNGGEICMQGRSVFMGYLNDITKTREAVDQHGWLHTGDIGRTDEESLIITGRVKELIITSGGENVPPNFIEDNVKKELPCVSNAVLIGDKRKFLTILLTLKTEVNVETGEPIEEFKAEMKSWLKENDCMANTVTELLQENSNKVMEAIQEGINRANSKAVSSAQRIQKFAILPVDFSIPTGELGPTMKLKRNIIIAKYKSIIEDFYK